MNLLIDLEGIERIDWSNKDECNTLNISKHI